MYLLFEPLETDLTVFGCLGDIDGLLRERHSLHFQLVLPENDVVLFLPVFLNGLIDFLVHESNSVHHLLLLLLSV